MSTRETVRIADELRRVLNGDSWSGPSLGSIVQDLPADVAALQPAGGGNSAWQLLEHIGCWLDVARIRLGGVAHEPDQAAHMPPPVPSLTEAEWRSAWTRVAAVGEALARAVEQAPDSRLEALAGGRDYTNYHLLHGVIQHTMYHAGQMALLARTQAGRSR